MGEEGGEIKLAKRKRRERCLSSLPPPAASVCMWAGCLERGRGRAAARARSGERERAARCCGSHRSHASGPGTHGPRHAQLPGRVDLQHLSKKTLKKAHNLIFYSFYNRQSFFLSFFMPRLATGEAVLAVRLDFCVLKCLRKIWHDCLGIIISCFIMQNVYAESAATCTRGQSISC